MTLPCFVLNDLDKPYPYIGVHTVADGTTMDAVARAAQELASAYYGKWNVKIELYRVSPYLAGSESPVADWYLKAQCARVHFEAAAVGGSSLGCECLIAVGELILTLTGPCEPRHHPDSHVVLRRVYRT